MSAVSRKEIPVVLFVFNRYNQLSETLKCLEANNIPLLYVFGDGPRNESDVPGIKKVRRQIDAIKWTKVVKVYQDKNKGLSQSIQDGLDKIFDKYDKAIVVEDDVCVSPEFYNYMSRCLDAYEDDVRIAGVTGLRYPFSKDSLSSDPYDVFLAPRFSSWGWGTWRRQWQQTSFNGRKLLKALDKAGKDMTEAGADLPGAVAEIRAGSLSGCWDVYFCMNMVISQKYFIWPKQNYIRSNGLTEGSHASEASAPPWRLIWESQPKDKLKSPSRLKKNDTIIKDFLAFFESLDSSTEEKIFKPEQQQTTKGVKMPNLKLAINKLANRAGYQVSKLPATPPTKEPELVEATPAPAIVEPEKVKKPDPKDYSTTDGPMEVPCQKVIYYHALNKLIRPSDKVLDVGSGLGYGMAILSVGAKEVQGVDVDTKAVKYAKAEYLGRNPKITNIHAYNGYKTIFKDNEFDIVTCIDVIEHVEDYNRFIDELLRIAKRAVIIGTPNRRPEFTNSDGTPKNYWHLREWSYPELNDILTKHPGRLDWHFIDGPFDGPFKVKDKVSKNTLVLMPIIMKGRTS
jgi:SAM-dependent methyltransferase